MREEINIVNFNKRIPLSVSLVRFDTFFRHMHSQAQLILFLDGDCDVFLDDTTYHATTNDMVIINPRSFHHLIADKYCTAISVMIDQRGFGLEEDELNSLSFNLNTMKIKNNPRYDQIRYLIYSIIKYNTMENVNSIYTNRAIAYSFFAQLMNDFGVTSNKQNPKSDAYDVATKISAYVNDHYQEKLTLNKIAEHFNYSVSYLSRLCKEATGHNFVYVYDYLRVNYSLNDLLLTKKTIEEIAQIHGFENARSYVRAFNNIQKINPTEYRKKYSKKSLAQAKLDKKILKKNVLDKILSKYDEYGQVNNSKGDGTRESEIVTNINVDSAKEKIVLNGADIFELNGAGDLFNEDSHDAITIAKKELNFKYILVPHILGRLTHILNKNAQGLWIVNYMNFDRMMQKILKYNCYPYLVFEYNNKLLTINEYYSIMLQIIDYLRIKYPETAAKMIVSLSFTNLNNPEYINGYNKEYFYLYEDLFKEFKSIKGIKMATPVFYKDDILNSPCYFNFIKKLKDHNLDFDYVAIRYASDSIEEKLLTKDKSEFKHFVDFLKEKDGFYENKMLFQGVNFTNNICLLNDTLYGSSYLIKNYIDNITDVVGYSKNNPFDKIVLSAYDPNPFHGESGLFTYNTIKKASFNAYVFISKLQKQILKREKNFVATIDNNKMTILVNNYVHYSDLFAEKEYFEISNLNRYVCFPKGTNINFKFNLSNIDFNEARIKISTICRDFGSSYDKWLQMGGLKSLKEEEINTLKSLSEISFTSYEEIVVNNSIEISATVSPLESKLIEIEFK